MLGVGASNFVNSTNYKVSLTVFEGPLDLLLNLIEDQKLDITTVSLAQVAEQYLQHLKSLTNLDAQYLADFLVVAAKLLVLKSRALLPMLEFTEEEEESAEDLARQLLEYKKYKLVAQYLKKLDNRRRQSFEREADTTDIKLFVPPVGVTSVSLAESIRHVIIELPDDEELSEETMNEIMSITEKIDDIQNRLEKGFQTNFAEIISSAKSKTEVIVTFLAMLELIKQRLVTVTQENLFSDIVIKRKEQTA